MLQPKKDKDELDVDDPDNDDSDEEEDEEEDDDILDMPPPWSPKLSLKKEKFLNLCPLGEKTVFYKKCRVDYYAPCLQVDGLVKKICIYEDFKRLILQETR